LKKLPLRKVVSILEHNWRQQDEENHIPNEILGVDRVLVEKVSEEEDENPHHQTHYDGDRCLLQVVELCRSECTRRWVKYCDMMK
jgi:hypothetical protein